MVTVFLELNEYKQEMKNTTCLFASLTNEKATTTATFSEAQKETLCKVVIYGTLKLMEHTVKRENPRKCAAHDSNKYNQSTTRITDSILSISLLSDNLPLPSSARDFRRHLPDEENKIGKAELSDILSSLTRRQLGLPKTSPLIREADLAPNQVSMTSEEAEGHTTWNHR